MGRQAPFSRVRNIPYKAAEILKIMVCVLSDFMYKVTACCHHTLDGR